MGSQPNEREAVAHAASAFAGLKVVDFGWVIVAPAIAACLANHGATVVRVESRVNLDPNRTFAPFKDGIVEPDHGLLYTAYNTNKYGISLNLTSPKGIELAKKLVLWSDVVIEGITPGSLVKKGLGYDQLKELKPDLIMLSTSNQGVTGPRRSASGYGTQLSGLSGFNLLTGWPDSIPSVPYGAYNDFVTPPFAVAAIIAALEYRRRTGKGLYIDVSQFEAGIQHLAPAVLDYSANRQSATRNGNRCPHAAPHGVFKCKGNDSWCAITVFTNQEWDSFVRIIGSPKWAGEARFSTLADRKRNEDELEKLVEGWTSRHDAGEVMRLLQENGIAAGEVRTPEGTFIDPQLTHRHHYVELDHPVIGRHTYDAPPFRLSGTPARLKMPAPCLGEHTHLVCTEFLGLPDEEFAELINAGAFD